MATVRTVKVTTDLSPQGFNKLAKYFKDMSHTLKTSFCTSISNDGANDIQRNAELNLQSTVGLGGYPITGEMETSWLQQRVGDTKLIINTHPNAAAVEFGTGIAGSQYSHPTASEVGYSYNVNGHTKAWTYSPNGIDFYQTKGIEAHRFMYYAIIDFSRNGTAIQNAGIKAFNKYFKDVNL